MMSYFQCNTDIKKKAIQLRFCWLETDFSKLDIKVQNSLFVHVLLYLSFSIKGCLHQFNGNEDISGPYDRHVL